MDGKTTCESIVVLLQTPNRVVFLDSAICYTDGKIPTEGDQKLSWALLAEEMLAVDSEQLSAPLKRLSAINLREVRWLTRTIDNHVSCKIGLLGRAAHRP